MNNNVTPTNSTSVVPAPPVSVMQMQGNNVGVMGGGNAGGGHGGGSPASSSTNMVGGVGSCGGGMPGSERMPSMQPRYLASVYAASSQQAISNAVNDHGPNNFATIRTTSIVTKQQKEHMQVRKNKKLNRILFSRVSETK